MTRREQWKALRAPVLLKLLKARLKGRLAFQTYLSLEPSEQMKQGGPVHTSTDRTRLDAFNDWNDAEYEQAVQRGFLEKLRQAERSGADPVLWKLSQ